MLPDRGGLCPPPVGIWTVPGRFKAELSATNQTLRSQIAGTNIHAKIRLRDLVAKVHQSSRQAALFDRFETAVPKPTEDQKSASGNDKLVDCRVNRGAAAAVIQRLTDSEKGIGADDKRAPREQC